MSSIDPLVAIGDSSGYAICEIAEPPDMDDLDQLDAYAEGETEVVFYIDAHGLVVGQVRQGHDESWFAYVPKEFI